MDAAGFLSTDGAVDDDGGDGDEVAELEEVVGDAVAPVEVADFVAKVAEADGGALEAFVGADDGDVVPHGAAEFVPVVVDDDEFVGVRGIAVFPGGDAGDVGGGFVGWVEALDFLEGAVGHDLAFEEGVGGEAVGSVEAGAGDFADGKESVDGGFAVKVGDNASALVVGGGDDGDRVLGGVVAESEEGVVDEGEAFLEETFRFAGGVEEDAGRAGAFDLGVDGTGHDIAGGEGAAFVELGDEVFAFFVEEDGAFAADCFGDEEGACFGAGGAGVVEAGGVKLHELHVGNAGSNPPSHGDAVTGGGVGVGGVEVGFAAATTGEDDAVGAEDFDFAGGTDEDVGAEDAVFGDVSEFSGGEEVDREVFLEQGEVRGVASCFEKRGGDLVSGGVLGMKDAALGVAAFLAEGVLIFVAVEIDAPGDEFLDRLGSFANDGADGLFVAESAAGIEGVGDVFLDGVAFVAEAFGKNGSDAALCPGGVGVEGFVFRDDDHRAELGGLDGEGESGDAGADHEEVRGHGGIVS